MRDIILVFVCWC